MATKTVLVDDMDGGDAELTIAFVINGESYSLDLSQANADKFYSVLAPYIAAAKANRNRNARAVEDQFAAVERRAAIREWARKKGLDIADRGRIPLEVVEEFDRTHRRRQ